MSALAQKFENGLCRCCLSEGLFKSLSDIDCSELQQEIFAVTLKNCFSISLSPMFGQYSETTYGICDMCIYKLREANSFKNLVQESETKFQQLYSNHIFKELDPTPQFKDEKVIEKPPMKRPKVEKNIEEIVMPSHVDMDDDDDVNDGDGDDHDNADDDDANDDSFDFNFDDSDDDDKTLFDLRKAKPTPKKAAKKKAVKLQDIEKKPEEKLKKGKKAKTSVEPKTKADKEKPADAEATERPKVVKRGIVLSEKYDTLLDPKTGLTIFSCNICEDVTEKSLKRIKEHVLSVHMNVQWFNCTACEKSYRTERILACHIRKFHMLERNIKCTQCEHRCFDSNDLKHHMVKHSTERKFKCKFCDKTFLRKSYCNLHERIHTKTEKNGSVSSDKYKITLNPETNMKIFSCQMCDQTEKNCLRIKEHILSVHYLYVPFKCEFCPEKFSHNETKKYHIRKVHTSKKSFNCSACDRTYKTKLNLSDHVRRFHMLEKNIKCPLCDHRCFNSQGLKNHMVKHSNERRFTCRFCKKTFQRKHNLDFHERIHTGDKRQVCPKCGLSFVQRASLTYHMAKTHP